MSTDQPFLQLYEGHREGAQVHDFEWRFSYANDIFLNYSGYSREELLGHTIMEKFPGIEKTELFRAMDHCMHHRAEQVIETEFVTGDNALGYFRYSIYPIPEGILILSTNLSEKRETTRLLHVNRLYAMINRVNKYVINAGSTDSWFRELCTIATAHGQFKMAWVTLFDNESHCTGLIHQSGIPEQETDSVNALIAQTGALYNRIRQTGLKFISSDLGDDPEMENWKAFSLGHGLASCAIIPVVRNNEVIGTLSLFSDTPCYGHDEEIQLLDELSDAVKAGFDIYAREQKLLETEALLARKEKSFRALIEKSSDMKTLATPDGMILYGSPAIEQVLGYELCEFLSSSWQDLVHPDDLPGVRRDIEYILEAPGNTVFTQHRARHKDGTWLWLEGNITNMLHEPEIRALVSNFRNVSEKKKIEEQHEFDLQNLNALINNTSDLIWSVDKDLNLITSNEPFSAMIRLLTGKAIEKGGNVLQADFPQEYLERFKTYYNRAFQGETFTAIEHIRTPAELWSFISFYPIRKGKEIAAVACYSRDITKIRQAEEKLRKNEERLKEAQATAHLGDFELNFITKIATWSEEACRIYGLPPEENQYSFEEWIAFIHPLDLEDVLKNIQDSQVTLQDQGMNYRIITRDGHVKHIFSRCKFRLDENGAPVALYGISQDVTDRMNQKLIQKRQARLEVKNKELERFAYIASHDLQEPLRTVSNYLRILEEDYSDQFDEKVLKYLNSVSDATRRMRALIKSLLDHSMLGINKRIALVDCRKMILEVMADLDTIIARSGAIIEVNEMPFIHLFEVEMRQVFQNLITNAIKFCVNGVPPRIVISSEKMKGSWKFSVRDNGIGISEQHIKKIFEIFQRLHPRDQYEGTGIGLANCKKIIEMHHGEIWVESEPGKGSTFYFTIPNLTV